MMVQDFYFCWHGCLYRQRSGLPMGSRLSPVLANIFLEEIENTLLHLFQIPPKLYVRFVDDIFVIYDKDSFNIDEFLQLFNDQHPEINLTIKHENQQQKLPFLDILVQQTDQIQPNANRSISLSIHRKTTHSHKYLHYRSSHPLSLKRNGFQQLGLRACRALKNHPANLCLELRYLSEVFANHKNSYPRYLINRWLLRLQRDIPL